MIKLKEKTEKTVKQWAKGIDLNSEEMLERIIHWAVHHAPKNLGDFDEYGLPYVSPEEEEDINRSFNKNYKEEETYSQEEVERILGMKD